MEYVYHIERPKHWSSARAMSILTIQSSLQLLVLFLTEENEILYFSLF